MAIRFHLWMALAVVLAAACAGSGEGGRYDATYDCEQSISCREETQGPAPAGVRSTCIENSSVRYATGSAAQQMQADALYAACDGLTACDYTGCVSEEIVAMGGQPPVMVETCNEGPLEPSTGEVPSSLGAFAYSEAEALFWVSDEHDCLTEVEVELRSGPCYVRFSADEGLIDDQGRYLITTVWLDNTGLCPGYPDTMGGSLHLETADADPFGTIEVIREEASWQECRPGQLIVRPNVTLTDFDGPQIELRDFELTFSGDLSQTHLDPIGSCPTVFF